TGSYPIPSFLLFNIDDRDGPPRLMGQRPHAFVDRPLTLTPSMDPRLGASSRHKELHRCGLWQIFSPAFRIGGLTRILRHSCFILLYHEIIEKSILPFDWNH